MNKFDNNIDNEKIEQLPLFSFSGKIVLVDTIEKYKKIKEELFLDKLLGFDTETKPTFVKGLSGNINTSLLQLSNFDTTYLFRLNKIGLQQEIINIFSSNKYTKVGLSIRDDIKSLKKIHNFMPSQFVDLQDVVKSYDISQMGLKKIAAIVLGVRISKAAQLSNWLAEELTEKQKLYAATDSWICREIYLKLQSISL